MINLQATGNTCRYRISIPLDNDALFGRNNKSLPEKGIKKPVIFNTSDGYYSFSKSSLGAPQTGHSKSSGTSSHLVPAATPLSGSPCSGS
jgi:hypothetical protein